MIKELSEAIVAEYQTFQLNGSDLTDTAELYANLAGEDVGYPFVTYSIVDSGVEYTTCSNIYEYSIQFSVFMNDKSGGLGLMSEIADVVLEGYNNAYLTGLDGTELRMLPEGIGRQRPDENTGYIIDIMFSLWVEKDR